MELLTHAQFAKKCGLGNGNLTNYLKRGKVFRDENGFYDPNNEVNALFIEKRGVRQVTEPEAPKAVVKSRKQKEAASIPQEKPPRQNYSLPTVEADGSGTGIERTIRILEANKKKREVELLGLKIDKLNATVIPTDVVKLVFSQQFKHTVVSFKDGAEKLIARLAKEVELNREQTARIRGELVAIINDAVKESIAESRKSISGIIEEYQEVRGKGERKE